jgi:hypothetical protein
MPQQKILEDEFPLARPQRTAASTARYLAIIGFWASLNLDDVVERAAMWALKNGILADAMCAALLLIAMARARGAVMNTDDTSSVDLGRPGPDARAISVPRAVLIERHARDR